MLTITATLFATAGCHKDDTNATLQGKWFLQSTRIQQYVNNTRLEDTTYLYTKATYEFTNDGTYIYQDEEGDTLHFTYTYNSGAHRLITVLRGDSSQYNVLSLTASQLLLHKEISNSSSTLIYDNTLRR